jgi:hypothetical protein
MPMRILTRLLVRIDINQRRDEDVSLQFSEDIDELDSITAVGVILRSVWSLFADQTFWY